LRGGQFKKIEQETE